MKRSVLVVDDDLDICANLKDILEDRGYRTDTAHDGPSALQLAEHNSYDIALLDFKMPGMNGAALYKRLRLQHPELNGIMITATSEQEYAPQTENAERLNVLRKPLDLESLLQLIDDGAEH